MPFRINYTDSFGANYPTSFWKIRYFTLNEDKYGSALYQGWASEEDMANLGDAGIVGEHWFRVTDPFYYDRTFGLAHNAQIWSGTAIGYFAGVERYITSSGIDSFLSPGTQLSYALPDSLEIGSQGSNRVIVTFLSVVAPFHTGYEVGSTIKINGVAATISAATAGDGIGYIVWFDLVETVDANDVVTWEYADTTLRVSQDGLLPHIAATAVTNTVGEYWQFNDANNSDQFALIF